MTRPLTMAIPDEDIPDMPAWVRRDAACRSAWRADLSWRCDAARAMTAAYRHMLRLGAHRRYGGADRA